MMDKMASITQAIYDTLIAQIATIGAFEIEEKKTCLHLSNGFAFAGIHPKKSWLDVNVVSDTQLSDSRIIKTEQVSKNRWHNLFRLAAAKDIDAQLMDFIKAAYELKKKPPYHKTVFSNAFFEKKFGVAATTRNIKVLKEILREKADYI